jgi:glutathione synthase/RimK-type ligase-like ATP-grasp enzyme
MLASQTINPKVLILASRYDFSCDYVVAALRALGTTYFRLNTEDLPDMMLELDPIRAVLRGVSPTIGFEVRPETLLSVYFRQPTFLRESALSGRPGEEQFSRAQWASFMRSLMVLDRCRWVNHPSRTYEAEHKAVQLRAAAELGFGIPRTCITNSNGAWHYVAKRGEQVAIKGLDTVLTRDGPVETFGYTNILAIEDVERGELASAPAIMQEALRDKLDLRVTVVGSNLWSASVTTKGKGIRGDWRLAKADAEFSEFQLPSSVSLKCIALTKSLGLYYGAIDLALCGDEYYFLEINPTGEWAWLQSAIGFNISEQLAKHLSAGHKGGGG